MQIFNPFSDNSDVQALLAEIGLPPQSRTKPYLDESELEEIGINFATLKAVASTEADSNKPGLAFGDLSMANVLNPEEAKKVLSQISRFGTEVSSLFRRATCPGKGTAASTILNNYLGIDKSRLSASLFGGVASVELICSIDQLAEYSVENLLGVHFIDKTAGTVRQYGDAVLEVLRSDGLSLGTAVVVEVHHDANTLMRVFTAHHVLFDNDINKLYSDTNNPAKLKIGEDEVPITKGNMIYANEDLDFVIFEITLPKKTDIKPLNIAEHPLYGGEQIWVIGYPAMAYNAKSLRLYSTGKVDHYADGFTQLNHRLFFGYSGGAIINTNGELVGIVQRFGPDQLQDDAHRSTFSRGAQVYESRQSNIGYLPQQFHEPAKMLIYNAVAEGFKDRDIANEQQKQNNKLFQNVVDQTLYFMEQHYPDFLTSCVDAKELKTVLTNIVDEIMNEDFGPPFGRLMRHNYSNDL